MVKSLTEPQFRLETLGGLSLSNGGRAMPGVALGRVPLALLARLAAAGDRAVKRDSLLALFWPESNALRARGSLKQALYLLRRDLDPLVVTGTNDLRVNPHVVRCDLTEFDAALRSGEFERAIDLYRGPFLDGVHTGSPPFSDWRDTEALRLLTRRNDALITLARCAETRGNWASAIRWWGALAAEDPLNAPVTISLMAALIKAGDRPGAVKRGRVYAAHVRSELGTEPDPSVLGLTEQLDGELRSSAIARHRLPVIAASSPSTEGASERQRYRRLSAAAAAVAVGAVVYAGVESGRFLPLDLQHVRVVTADGPSRGGSLISEVRDRLLQLDPALEVSTDGIRARFVANLIAQVEGDSIRLSVGLVDRADASRTVLGPVKAPLTSASAGARALGEQLGVLLSAARNPALKSWSHATALPHNWEGYRAFLAGIESWTHVGAQEPIDHFRRAATLDPSSATSVVWLAFVMTKQMQPGRDSVLRVLQSWTGRAGPWDHAMIRLLSAWSRGDISSSHAAGHDLLAVAPMSEWAILPAYDAMTLGRQREALSLLANAARPAAWAKWFAFVVEAQARHLSGDFAGEEQMARVDFAREPDRSLARQVLVRALSGIGRVEEVKQLCIESLQLPGHGVAWQPCGQAIRELWAHGHVDVARELTQHYFRAIDAEPSLTRTQKLTDRAATLAAIGQWSKAAGVLSEIPTPPLDDPEYVTTLTLVKAARGEVVGLQTLRRSAEGPVQLPFLEAGVAALRNQKEEAVDLILAELRRGSRFRTALHLSAMFGSLRGYERFDELLRERDDASHRQQYADR